MASTPRLRFPAQKDLIVMLDNTAQGGSIEKLSAEVSKILFDKPHTLPKMSPVEAMLKLTEQNGVAAAIALYRSLKSEHADQYDFSEPELNRLGYQLLGRRKVNEAIEIFKLNVEAYPEGFNTYDSLGEAYMTSGNKELAIQNYKKSLELNPKNTGATQMLSRLESKTAPVDAKNYEVYVGEYEVTPSFIVKMFIEGDKLMTQATNQPPFELLPEGGDNFSLKVVNARVTFSRDDKGAVTGLVIHQNGRDVPGKKIK